MALCQGAGILPKLWHIRLMLGCNDSLGRYDTVNRSQCTIKTKKVKKNTSKYSFMQVEYSLENREK